MLRIGLTGGIACGKSYVASGLRALGIPTLDLDSIAHEAMAPGGPAYHEVVESFGRDVLTKAGTIDRGALGQVVFADEAARNRLNAIVHPRVREREAEYAARLEGSGSGLLVTEAALLVESGGHPRFDRLVVAHCSPSAQLQRVMDRGAFGAEEARRRIDSQLPSEEKVRFAHYDVDTSGTLADTDTAVSRLAEELLRLSEVPHRRIVPPRERALGVLLGGPQKGPRGLSPRLVLREIVEGGGLEMERLRRVLDPPTEDPWYRAARPGEGDPGADVLVGPLALWTLARGADAESVAAAGLSLSLLTHTGSERAASTCLAALAVLELASSGRIPTGLERFKESAERWGRYAVPNSQWARLTRTLEAMAAAPGEGADKETLDLLGRL